MNTLQPLTPTDLPELAAWWREAHPLHPVPAAALAARLFNPHGSGPDLWLAERDKNGILLAIAFGAVAWEGSKYDGLRWFGIHPRALGAEGGQHGGEPPAGRQLLEELTRRLAARGVRHAVINAVPPFYIRPGVDTRETALVARLLEWGWALERTNYNLTVDLTRWACPPDTAIFEADAQGRRVRRATPADREPLAALIRTHWSEGWCHEALQALELDPARPPLFVAEQPQGNEVDSRVGADSEARELVGFAAHDVGNVAGCFGPTGVAPTAQGGGLGKRLLWACLRDVQRAGFAQGEIGWVGPIPFYHRQAGATIGPLFAVLGREL